MRAKITSFSSTVADALLMLRRNSLLLRHSSRATENITGTVKIHPNNIKLNFQDYLEHFNRFTFIIIH